MLTLLMTIVCLSVALSTVMIICAFRAPNDGWDQTAPIQLDVLNQVNPHQAK